MSLSIRAPRFMPMMRHLSLLALFSLAACGGKKTSTNQSPLFDSQATAQYFGVASLPQKEFVGILATRGVDPCALPYSNKDVWKDVAEKLLLNRQNPAYTELNPVGKNLAEALLAKQLFDANKTITTVQAAGGAILEHTCDPPLWSSNTVNRPTNTSWVNLRVEATAVTSAPIEASTVSENLVYTITDSSNRTVTSIPQNSDETYNITVALVGQDKAYLQGFFAFPSATEASYSYLFSNDIYPRPTELLTGNVEIASDGTSVTLHEVSYFPQDATSPTISVITTPIGSTLTITNLLTVTPVLVEEAEAPVLRALTSSTSSTIKASGSSGGFCATRPTHPKCATKF